MSERVRFGSARPGVRRSIVKALRESTDFVQCGAADEIESLERRISRIGGVLVEVLEWADTLYPPGEARPDWVEKLTIAVEDEC